MACQTCKHFVRQYGDLCVVGDDGNLIPLCWSLDLDRVPESYKEAVKCVANSFAKRTVGAEFILQRDHSQTLGTPHTGKWTHLSMRIERSTPPRNPKDTQSAITTYIMLSRMLRDNSIEVIQTAHHLIYDNQLPFATSHKPAMTFLKDTAEKLEKVKGYTNRRNLITCYSREAFNGCLSALRGGMVGFLLELVADGDTFEEIKQKWVTKAGPLKYLQPTATPSVGNIESAENIFRKLGYTPRDLERVYLTLKQVPQQAIMWSPVLDMTPQNTDTNPAPQKHFGSLLLEEVNPSLPDYSEAPIKDCTFRHFALKVLPTAKTILVLPKEEVRPYFFTTGKEGSKPIMSFHQEGGHTASWYTWGNAGSAFAVGLKPEWTPVTAIITFPHMFDHFEKASDIFDAKKTEAFKFK